MRYKTVGEWLTWQESLNPKDIDLGLDRVLQVKKKLNLEKLDFYVITIAGTNGKGSCVALLASILSTAGYRVGTYTSPHLLHYNERIVIDNKNIDNEALCDVFDSVDIARGSIPLTYFEFGTLAAVLAFSRVPLDVAIMEVGLGGRLDAVNAFEPDMTLISSISIDHTDWLGHTRNRIAAEKAGILRHNIPLVCGDSNPPHSLLVKISELKVPAYFYGKDFEFTRANAKWNWRGLKQSQVNLEAPGLLGNCQFINASCVLMALSLLDTVLPVSAEAIQVGLTTVKLPGRCQIVRDNPTLLVDVAHNVDSVKQLANSLSNMNSHGQTHAVFSALENKDIMGIVNAISKQIDVWHIAQLNCPRAASIGQITENLASVVNCDVIYSYCSIQLAYDNALTQMKRNDRIVVFGSFYTVSAILSENNQRFDNERIA